MAHIVNHPCPCAPSSPNAVTILVDLTPWGMQGRIEQLVVEPSPAGGYVVACLPWFTYGIHFGDLVFVNEVDMSFERVVKSSGLRTL